MSQLKWIFDPAPPSGREQGGDAFSNRLDESGLKMGELFARESIANSADQKITNSSSPVKIYVDVISISGETKERFKKALDWERLTKHVDAASFNRNDNALHHRIFSAIRKFNTKDDSITLVRVSDYGANGLTGDEIDTEQNFHLFSKAMLLSKNNKNNQGSFGLGKGVFYHLSNLRTVLMSSQIEEGGTQRIRLFGRSELPSHECEDEGTERWNVSKRWDGPGFFGISDNEQVPSAQSSFNESIATQKDLFLNRDNDLGTGTSVISIDFESPYGDASSTVIGLTDHIRKWFWPALAQSSPEIEIYVREFKNHDCLTNDGKITLNEQWKPFADVLNHPKNTSKIEDLGGIIQQNISTNIPKDNNNVPAFDGIGEVKIHTSDIQNTNSGHIALLRNKLCVVNYEKISKPEEIQGNVYGVYLAGKARENPSSDDESFHQFLRLAEPALHNDWLFTPKIKLIYRIRNSSKFLKDHLSSIHEEVKKMLYVDTGPKKENLDHLSDKFQFGSKGTDPRPKSVSFNFFNQIIKNNILKVTLEINCLKPTENNWKSNCTISILGHSGVKNNIKIKDISILKPEHKEIIKSHIIDNYCLFDAPSSIQTFKITLVCEIPKIILSANEHGKKINPKNINYKIDVIPRTIN